MTISAVRNTLVFQCRMLKSFRFIYLTGVEVVRISGLVRKVLHVGFWLCGVLFLSGIVEAADHPAFQPVKELFAAMSKHDGKAMQGTSTEDFQLLEHGEDWTMQKLVDAVQPMGKASHSSRGSFWVLLAASSDDQMTCSKWRCAIKGSS